MFSLLLAIVKTVKLTSDLRCLTVMSSCEGYATQLRLDSRLDWTQLIKYCVILIRSTLLKFVYKVDKKPLFPEVNIRAVDDLATQVARASAAMVLPKFTRKILLLEWAGLRYKQR